MHPGSLHGAFGEVGKCLRFHKSVLSVAAWPVTIRAGGRIRVRGIRSLMSFFNPNASAGNSPQRAGARKGWRRWSGVWLVCGIGASLLLISSVFAGLPDRGPAAGSANSSGGGAFIGDAACSACHGQIAQTYQSTAHARTSALGSGESVQGRFERGRNELRTANPNLYFLMEQSTAGCFQTAVMRTSVTEVLTRKERMDVVIGSGRKGQTYLYWDDDKLFQLPVSYWSQSRLWVNSPGYVDGTAVFERPIARRCLECHATTFVSGAPPENAYERSGLMLGVGCEKCHGPGAEHVKRYQSANPPRSVADAAIVNPARLARDRKIDVCALCHAGIGQPLTVPLSFLPGDVLASHLAFPPQPPEARIDVHAGQVELLERSRCFQASPAMNCATCHDVHQPQRNLAVMAQKCINCHQVERCGEFRRTGRAIADGCVACHMPLEQTDQIVIARANGQTFDPSVRNHRIGVYRKSAPQ